MRVDTGDLLRRAAGQRWRRMGGVGNCLLRLVCVDCPSEDRVPPYLNFDAMISTHHRVHLRTYPAHRLLLWCWDHLAFHVWRGDGKRVSASRACAATWRPECGLTLARWFARRWPLGRPHCGCSCTEMVGLLPGTSAAGWVPMVSKGRGGRRAGAGAPKGNANRMRHGRRSADVFAREALRHLPERLRAEFVARLGASRKGTAVRSITADNQSVSIDRTRPALSIVQPASIPRTQRQDVQSNFGPYADIVARLAVLDFRNPAPFVRRHARHVDAMRASLDYVESLEDDGRCRAGLWRDDFHLAVSEPDNGSMVCPAGDWEQGMLPREDTGT